MANTRRSNEPGSQRNGYGLRDAGRSSIQLYLGNHGGGHWRKAVHIDVRRTSKEKEASERGANFMLSVIKGIEPRNQIEAMLAAQMTAVHMATMTFARRLAHVDNIPQQDSASNAFNKLARTFAAQMSALKEYRSKGEQKMTIQHVHVAEGGQAIVGNVNAPTEGIGARKKSEDQPHALGYAPGVRCHAKSKRSGLRCQAPAVRWSSVCRMHGAGGGAPKGNRNAMKHGGFTTETLALKREIQALARLARETMASIEYADRG
jgi:hypothetical protein